MNAEKVVEIMGRELGAIGQYYRNDWSGFDGRTLRSELDRLARWGAGAVNGDGPEDFTEFTEQLAEQANDG